MTQTWILDKAAARGHGGVVVAQAWDAAAAGLGILEAGGNAVDAAVATAFALAAVEPWNSGLGGIGFALVQPAGEPRAAVVDFGPVAPAALTPEHFPLTGRPGGDLFGWPEAAGDANVHGPLSVCVPSAIAGYGTLHARWGRLPWTEVLAPAIDLARRGLELDWYAALKVLNEAAVLRRYPESARIYVPGGLPRGVSHPSQHVNLGNLADTLEHLSRAGAADATHGDIAHAIAGDVASRGGVLSRADLAGIAVILSEAAELPWRSGVLQVAGAQTAGPALLAALAEMEQVPLAEAPEAAWYAAMARALRRAQAGRLGLDGSTSHLCVVDREGGMVSLTTTLLSLFGSRMVLPQTGILPNNGVMWFDPRPGARNGVAGGARPLTNMCPVIWRQGDAPMLAAGASGGRRILAAVAQMLAFVLDFGMDPQAAALQPRIDVSSPDSVTADARLGAAILQALAADGPVAVAPAVVSPNLFAAASLLRVEPTGARTGVADPASPSSAALAEALPDAPFSLSAAAAPARMSAGRRSSRAPSPRPRPAADEA